MREEKKKTRYVEKEEEPEIIIEEKEKKEHPRLRKAIITIGLILLAIFIYIHNIEPKHFVIKEYKVEDKMIPESFNGIKIVQFSDVHYGTTVNKKELDKIVTLINQQKPDIIVFTGDLIDKTIIIDDSTKNEITASLSKLEATLYKYAIYGNEDDEKEYKEIMENSHFNLLKNETTLLYYQEENPILISGFDPLDSSPKYSVIAEKKDDIETTNLYKIVLAHEPDTIYEVVDYNPNLVLTGSTLGGSINIIRPWFVHNAKHFLDYERINETDLYISNGLGTKGLNVRFNNPPSITLYRLYTEKE